MEPTPRIRKQPDWALLIFMIGAVNVKLYIKIAAVVFYFAYLLFIKHSFAKKLAGPAWFYLLMPVVGILSAAVWGSFGVEGYWFSAGYGTLQWLLAGIIFYLLCTTVTSSKTVTVKATVRLFFTLNLLISIGQVVRLMIASKHLMPYWFDDEAHVYGASTGDYICGIFGGHSITNAVVCSLGMIYFIFEKQPRRSLSCMLVMLLCTSNITLFITLLMLIPVVLLVKTKASRGIAIAVFVLTIGIYFFLSPMNVYYVRMASDKLLHKKERDVSAEQDYYRKHKYEFFTAFSKDDAYKKYPTTIRELKETRYTNELTDTTLLKDELVSWYGKERDQLPITLSGGPGKLYTLKQTQYSLLHDPRALIGGYGLGNFSSKLAMKMTGLGIQGECPDKYIYVSQPFFEHHFYTTLYYFARPVAEHSIVNMPDSVYNQVAGEYGLIGLFLFALLYIGYFFKTRIKNSYGIYLLLLLLLFFGYGYWFEMISLTVIFELLMLTDIYNRPEKA